MAGLSLSDVLRVIDLKVDALVQEIAGLRVARTTLIASFTDGAPAPAPRSVEVGLSAAVPAPRVKKASGRPRRDRNALQHEIFVWLAQHTAPVGFSAVVKAMKANKGTLRQCLNALIDMGAIRERGHNRYVQFALPAVMAAAEEHTRAARAAEALKAVKVAQATPAPAQTPKRSRLTFDDAGVPHRVAPAAKPPAPSRTVHQAILRVLASGASYSIHELVRHVKPTLPTADAARLLPVLDELRIAADIDRIPVGESFRYRSRGRVSLKAAEAVSA